MVSGPLLLRRPRSRLLPRLFPAPGAFSSSVPRRRPPSWLLLPSTTHRQPLGLAASSSSSLAPGPGRPRVNSHRVGEQRPRETARHRPPNMCPPRKLTTTLLLLCYEAGRACESNHHHRLFATTEFSQYPCFTSFLPP